MKQTIFETKQRADELLRNAIEIWQKSDQSDFLDGLEKDPVFSLLITALAYQANETESELEQYKSDVLNDFASMLTPYEENHAIPATTIVETSLSSRLSEMELDADQVFRLKDSEVTFIPLLRTRILNVSINSVVRLDGRRWKVALAFKSPVSDLSGFCFAIKDKNFRDVTVTVNGQVLPLVKPWNISNLPLSSCFDIDTVVYNNSQSFMASPLCMDLFVCQNVRMFCIQKHPAAKILSGETYNIDMIFEFRGVSDEFVLDKENLSLNTVLLVNAEQQTITLSSADPIARVAGYNTQMADKTIYGRQFLHLIRPSDDQLYGNLPVEVRRVAADRFNQGTLVRLLNNLINKYYSDYYAFQNIQDVANDKLIGSLTEILSRLQNAAKRDEARSVPGVYLMLRPTRNSFSQHTTLDVSYVTTLGAAVNPLLNESSVFIPPTGLVTESTRQISNPMMGVDEIRDVRNDAILRRYITVTHDRLVTPADLKLFCYHELQVRYGIERNMVETITINHRQQYESRLSGYEILVEITLTGNPFIKRGFAEKVPLAEVMLQEMMLVRSANIYPIKVKINISES